MPRPTVPPPSVTERLGLAIEMVGASGRATVEVTELEVPVAAVGSVTTIVCGADMAEDTPFTKLFPVTVNVADGCPVQRQPAVDFGAGQSDQVSLKCHLIVLVCDGFIRRQSLDRHHRPGIGGVRGLRDAQADRPASFRDRK